MRLLHIQSKKVGKNMKKKLLTLLLLTMIISVVGCSKAEESVEPSVGTSVEESVVETVVEETTIEEVVSIVEETTEEVVEDPTSESNSTAQIIKLLETYKGIMNGDDVYIKMAQDNCETFNGKWDMDNTKFADGTSCTQLYTIISIATEYYENCLAGNEPWDTVTWMSQQVCEKDVLLMNFNENGETDEGCDTKLWNATYVVPYLANQSSIELINRVETDEYKFTNGQISKYTYDLIINGVENTGFKAVYDSEGNLLNIVLPDDFVLPEEFYSFDQNLGQ